MSIVLKDIFGKDFTDGDRVAITTASGHRIGKVVAIKDIASKLAGEKYYKVFIDLSEHRSIVGRGNMLAKRMGYEYSNWNQNYFLKL